MLKFTSLAVVLLFLVLYGSYGVGSRAAIRDPQSAMPKPYWAFVKPQRSVIPAVKDQKWVRNPIDAFVLAKLEEKGLQPSPTADKRTLLRRVTFDLTGLPPTPEEIKTFLADSSPDAYEKVVDRLLASPKYGERWAQHWLDVVRFGETNGFELDADREQAWRYRDYVVNSLNADKPYSQFILEQIAGDELDANSFEMRVATGFLRAGPQHVVAGNLEEAELRQEWLTEVMFGIGNGVMGLTVGCARCHDHKFDPIPQADFYRLQAFFAASDNYDYRKPTKEQEEAFQTANRIHKEKLQPIQDQIKAIEKPYQDRLKAQKRAALEPVFANALAKDDKLRTVEEKQLAKDAQRMLAVQWDELVASLSPEDKAKRAALRRQMHQINLYEPEPIPKALAVNDILKPIPTMHLLRGGDWRRPGAEVQPAFLSAVEGKGNVPEIKLVGDSPGRRLALARWLTKPDHPLTARVMVNRLWHHHFGRGIVATPNDFGRNGQQPTHPELLDWLATELVKPGSQFTVHSSQQSSNWSLKHIHRLMVTSATYRQSSRPNSQSAFRQTGRNPQSVDPDNKLLWRMNRQRLDAEAIRDAVLAVNGTLNDQAGGAPIRVPLDPEVYDTIFTEGEPDNLWPVHPDMRQHARRSLYLLRKRNVRLPMLVAFDSPDMMNSCGARSVSVHALQSLTLMNSKFMFDQSKALASRLFAETVEFKVSREDKMITRLYELALGRLPSVEEKRMTRTFLKDQTVILRQRIAKGEKIAELPELPDLKDLKDLKEVDAASAAAWVDLCLSTYNLNEFVYLR
ncbi:MAG: DUF1549 and DUF1553 domain-containing protein [Acidobacteriota bacterium]|nr:DUF1549 and DUF1553 domain-containing protein [Acidobacteriota bacterium]